MTRNDSINTCSFRPNHFLNAFKYLIGPGYELNADIEDENYSDIVFV